MATEHQVTCTTKNKDNVITMIGSSGMKWTKAEAIEAIEDGDAKFYTYVATANRQQEKVYVHVVKQKDGSKHLQTDPDKTTRNNLLELPDCGA